MRHAPSYPVHRQALSGPDTSSRSGPQHVSADPTPTGSRPRITLVAAGPRTLGTGTVMTRPQKCGVPSSGRAQPGHDQQRLRAHEHRQPGEASPQRAQPVRRPTEERA